MKTVEERLHYKDKSPIETVNEIRSILSKNGFEVCEEWREPDEYIGTYTVRVTLKGTTVGSNGKGVNKEYARASGYAELIERLQNDILLNDCTFGREDGIDFNVEPDEKIMSAKEIIKENNSFVKLYLKENKMEKMPNAIKIRHFKNVHRIDYMRTGKEDQYLTTPFYSLKEKRIVNLPTFAYKCCYGSNGMSAGNTKEEALTQGLSEIIERYVLFLTFKDNISFPDIPLSYLDRYPYIKDMYMQLSNVKGYRFALKDCSLGGKYPVAALLCIENDTGKFGIKFGCHPDFGIAMERTFTEATQGRKIFEYADCSILDFFNEEVYTTENLANTCKVGNGFYPYQMFEKNSTYEFTPMIDVSEKSNKEILHEMLESICKDGYDVLVRDVSFMGFPSYHIIIPGMSEIKKCKDELFRIHNTQCYIMRKLTDINSIDEEDCSYITSLIRHYVNSFLENDIHKLFINAESDFVFPGENVYSSTLLLAAMCNVFSKEYDKASYFMKCLLKTAQVNGVDMKNDEVKKYIAMRYYLDGMINIGDHKEVIDYLKQFFDKSIVSYLEDLFSEPRLILRKMYGNINKNKSNISVLKHVAKVNIEKAKMNNIIDQTKLAAIH
ncbi:YcaO-like family protein [Lachnospira multipara]|uniref:Ribosomal protein S12 methylthiotransferase accessory factor n=1 Tax=Lachnospira multipara TaxID=28051 RepID=A0A1H5SID2_9FIRM|nr:YcaO-like family protein [Lachnospira multipara]SEF49561.1 ribosomal protein S12 methylthiotransferase accessory factor [Lachnospira multipara]